MTAVVVNNLPKRWTGWHDESTVVVGTSNPISIDSNQPYGFYVNYGIAGSGADGDAFTQSIWVAAGTYTLRTLGVTGDDAAIVDIYLDNVLIQAGVDWYSASQTFNVVKTTPAFVISTNGYHVLKWVTNGYSGISANRLLYFTKFSMKQSAD